jgi:hypothetical protein
LKVEWYIEIDGVDHDRRQEVAENDVGSGTSGNYSQWHYWKSDSGFAEDKEGEAD